MKKEVTRKYLKYLYGNKSIQLGYCEMQNLFNEHTANYYTCGVYGWNFDGFCVNGALVATGYRGMFGIEPKADIIKEFEQKAINLKKEYWLKNTNELNNKMYELRTEFVNKVLNN